MSSNTHKSNTAAKIQSHNYATTSGTDESSIELSEDQMKQLHAAHRLRKRLNVGLNKATGGKEADSLDRVSIESVLKAVPDDASRPDEARLLGTLEQVYAGKMFADVQEDLAKATMHRNSPQRRVTDNNTKQILTKLGMLEDDSSHTMDTSTEIQGDNDVLFKKVASSSSKNQGAPHTPVTKRRQSLMQALAKARSSKLDSTKKSKTISHPPFPTKPQTMTINPSDLELKPIHTDNQPPVPELSFDLSRVLFNPGVYQLQDPRSRVFNFDPYLERPMPISEFNFDALNAYVTSSQDQGLLGLARSHDKRYIGSSSSMSAALCQFHFLLSQWRGLSVDQMSKGFSDIRTDFTQITRAPAAVFLRYRDGVYAVDADKEYDTPNVLMSLGKSLEKLLTLEKDELEKWRRTNTAADASFSDPQNEAFHYSEQGRFLLRSQLDAYDPRLPGSGVFDLKTRAVAGIRMNMHAHEEGTGYQIKERFGTWESYEREYYDMMRSNFLKYSMQVRMGNMDGIFVAYHNIEQIFGFQYISLADMDYALHGQRDSSLGDQEFRLSINLLQTMFDKVTQQYPEQSIRFHFETREPSVSEPKPFMHIFAEPMTNEEIDGIQKRKHAEIAAFEKRVFKGEDQSAEIETEASQELPVTGPVSGGDVLTSPSVATESVAKSSSPSTSSTAADTAFLDKLDDLVPPNVTPKGPRPLMAFRLDVQNKVDDRPVTRPEKLSSKLAWSVGYTMQQLSEDSARRHYAFCKNRRMGAFSATKRQASQFIQNIRDMSYRGAEYRQRQVEADAERETVVLYQDSIKS